MLIIDGRTITRRLTRAEIRFARKHGDLPALRIADSKSRAGRIVAALPYIYAASMTVVFAVTVYKAQPLNVELAAYTWAGERFVAGSGDSCNAAFDRARIPEDWRELTCEAFDVFGFRVEESR